MDAFLTLMGWANTADEPFIVKHVLTDQSLPARLPRTLTMRALFTRYLDINAIPRRSFFALLRYFVTDELEQEKLDEFLSPEGVVSHRALHTPSMVRRLTRVNRTTYMTTVTALGARYEKSLRNSAVRQYQGTTFLTCFLRSDRASSPSLTQST